MKIIRLSNLLLIGTLFFHSCSGIGKKSLNIGYLLIDDTLSDEDKTVLDWLEAQNRFIPQQIRLEKNDIISRGIDVAWIHLPDTIAYETWRKRAGNLKAFRSLVKTGMPFLLTDYAAFLPYDAGLETWQPEVRRIQIEDDWLFDQKGFQSRRGHPVFEGLFGGAFVWDGFEDHELPVIGYFGTDYPQEGRVAAVEKSFITVHGDRRLVTEYISDEGSGRILSVGAFVYFNSENRLDFRLGKFLENCLNYLCHKGVDPSATYWIESDNSPKAVSVSTEPIRPPHPKKWPELPRTELSFIVEKPGDDFYDVAGRRALVMGKERGGIDELWVHPFRILRDFEAGIVRGDSVAWLKHMPCRLEIRPESIIRTYRSDVGEIKEVVFPSFKKAGAIIHYEAEGSGDVDLVIRFRSDLRWMWPYDELALGDVVYGYDESLKALHVREATRNFYCLFGAYVKPEQHLEGAFENIEWEGGSFKGRKTELNQVFHASLYRLTEESGYSLDFALVGTDQGQEEALSHYRTLLVEPLREYVITTDHYQNVLNNLVTIESSDDEFNRLWKWTLVGTDRFFVETPLLGKALVAGYATTARGWDGRHKISGRPGYGWYFGRDAVWSAFAVDDYGDFASVKDQLRFFQKFQDVSGKIFHELSTSGVVHYDAADATPLYVILAAHVLRASGDVGFIRESWPYLKRAMDFLYTTDTDGDGLIENTNVGHGWVEGGKLWGAHTTFYLAGLWAQTLRDAAYMASHLSLSDLCGKYRHDFEKVRNILNTDFWNEEGQFFYYGKNIDGSFNPEKTVLPAVVMYYDLLDDDKVGPILNEYAGNGFSSDWGVRILSSESPLFNPRGYHYGSVWPLYTGWTALAEYVYGHSIQGFSHIYSNMMIKNHWAKGFVEEVMNGVVYQPSGVCPHQCWSETNVLHPGIAGMIGWRPSAPENVAELRPRFPLHWDRVRVENLRMGGSRMLVEIQRSPDRTDYRFSLQDGKNFAIRLFPEIPEGMTVREIKVNDGSVPFSSETWRGLLKEPVEFQLKNEVVVTLFHQNGIGIVPVMPRPEPGDKSKGFRIVDTRPEDGKYVIDLEGPSGSMGRFRLKTFDQTIADVKGGRIVDKDDAGNVALEVIFPKSHKEFVKKQVRIHHNQ